MCHAHLLKCIIFFALRELIYSGFLDTKQPNLFLVFKAI